MKIRIQGNTVRLRLSKSEVEQIGVLSSVVEKTNFDGENFTFTLTTHSKGDVLKAHFSLGKLTISMNATTAKKWANSDLVGVENLRESKVYILVEKDFQCLTERKFEDESDLFSNPNTNC